jgi:predicted kinase
MLEAGDTIPLDATVWFAPNERATMREVVEDRPVLLLFYLFDWSST